MTLDLETHSGYSIYVAGKNHGVYLTLDDGLPHTIEVRDPEGETVHRLENTIGYVVGKGGEVENKPLRVRQQKSLHHVIIFSR